MITLFLFIFKGMDVLGFNTQFEYDIARRGRARSPTRPLCVSRSSDTMYTFSRKCICAQAGGASHRRRSSHHPLPTSSIVFMTSTSNGYEGPVRLPTLTLAQQLRESTRPSSPKHAALGEDASGAAVASISTISSAAGARAPPKARMLRRIKHEMPIR